MFTHESNSSPSPAASPSPHVSACGLSAAEVADRVARGEVNRAASAGWAEYRDIALRNVATLFNAMVVPAAIALFFLGDLRGAWAVSALAVVNSLVGLVQEIRTKRHLDKLAILTAPHARVLRDGKEASIPASEVVLDDAVLLAPGEAVVADGILLTARFLEVDEALLTGESDPIPRQAGARLLSGSFCIAGDGVFRVEKVGGESFVQQTSTQARRYRYVPSPMQLTLDTLIGWLTALAVALCVLYVALRFLRGFPTQELWQMIAATVTSMVPQGLVLMTTLAFSLSALRMSRRGALVQRLNAVESMASVDVLCMDKTGTLTTNRLRLDRMRILEGDENAVRMRLQLFAWTSIDEGNKSIQALRTGLGALAAPTPELIEQIPFKSQNRYSAVHLRTAGEEQILVLGAFESLRALQSEAESGPAEAIWRELLPTGLRLLVFAEAKRAGNAALSGSLEGYSLRPLALVALSDELRPEAGAVLEALSAQGIRLKILSGDNPETVRATVAHLRLPLAQERVATGVELDAAPDRPRLIRERSVFGRVTPQQKLEIIGTLQAQGSHVGMIGDGVNDILGIKRSDLGIAMGEGSGATKTVAGLVLENNRFALLPETLEEGRLIVGNLRRAAKLFLLKNVYTLLLIVIATGLLGLEFPYLPQQVTLLNALAIGGPAFVILLSRHRDGKSASAVQEDFLREVGWFAASAGLVMGLVGLAVWLLSAWWTGDDLATQRTLLLTTLILLGLGNVLFLAEGDRRLYGWTALALPVYAALMYLEPTANFFALTPLSLRQWLSIAATATVGIPLCFLVVRRK